MLDNFYVTTKQKKYDPQPLAVQEKRPPVGWRGGKKEAHWAEILKLKESILDHVPKNPIGSTLLYDDGTRQVFTRKELEKLKQQIIEYENI